MEIAQCPSFIPSSSLNPAQRQQLARKEFTTAFGSTPDRVITTINKVYRGYPL
jgi:hypothetical protein